MSTSEAMAVVAKGKPVPCWKHAHGTWELAERFDKTCPEYLASAAYQAALVALRTAHQ